MPTYEYECDTCKRTFEEFQSITASPLTDCRFEGCTGKVRRLLSAGAGILFKGSGFYQTDYRSESYRQKASSESGEGKAAASGTGNTSSSSTASGASSSSQTTSTPAAAKTAP